MEWMLNIRKTSTLAIFNIDSRHSNENVKRIFIIFDKIIKMGIQSTIYVRSIAKNI